MRLETEWPLLVAFVLLIAVTAVLATTVYDLVVAAQREVEELRRVLAAFY